MRYFRITLYTFTGTGLFLFTSEETIKSLTAFLIPLVIVALILKYRKQHSVR